MYRLTAAGFAMARTSATPALAATEGGASSTTAGAVNGSPGPNTPAIGAAHGRPHTWPVPSAGLPGGSTSTATMPQKSDPPIVHAGDTAPPVDGSVPIARLSDPLFELVSFSSRLTFGDVAVNPPPGPTPARPRTP
jgi:hypothetical protein